MKKASSRMRTSRKPSISRLRRTASLSALLFRDIDPQIPRLVSGLSGVRELEIYPVPAGLGDSEFDSLLPAFTGLKPDCDLLLYRHPPLDLQEILHVLPLVIDDSHHQPSRFPRSEFSRVVRGTAIGAQQVEFSEGLFRD